MWTFVSPQVNGVSFEEQLKRQEAFKSLCRAAAKGDFEEVYTLVEQNGVDILECADAEGFTALHFAAANGHRNTVRIILQVSPDPAHLARKQTEPQSRQVTPLHLACLRGHTKCVADLLQCVGREAFQLMDAYGRTCGHCAAESGSVALMASLIDLNDIRLLQTKTKRWWLPFHEACYKGDAAMVDTIVKHTIPHLLESTTDEGLSALHLAAHAGHAAVVSLLLLDEATATLLHKSTVREGQTALPCGRGQGPQGGGGRAATARVSC
ncbi:unnamed protein product [Vitrella brassicaformis CCMP3155]|uniref:Uncharacterized protein n=1 Tax=Vitrella brassicaformis (strain CCMP3155) TaxID=1169540 RepID=A0A0G4G7A6_VITBC|nr:unnamed protein product [Vitrella brassicaformis CCMP3155]|eukprot:CEM24130.1 unnamed protein product [Vitrella brassicaformis CCMP3155]